MDLDLLFLIAITVTLLVILSKTASHSREKYRVMTQPLLDLLGDDVTLPGHVISFVTFYRVRAIYKKRKLVVEMNPKSGGGIIEFTMHGLRKFPKQPFIISEYPKIVGNAQHVGQTVKLYLNMQNHSRATYESALNDLVESCKILESEA